MFGFYLLASHAELVLGPAGAARGAVAGDDRGLVDALARGMRSDDGRERKAALTALTHALGAETAGRTPWLELVATTHAFDDFAAHLNDAARVHVDALHPASPGSDVSGTSTSSTPEDVRKEGDARETSGDPNETLLLPYEYVLSAWTRGLRHPNPSVRAGTLRTFCDRDWARTRARSNPYVGALTESFVVEALVPSAMEFPGLRRRWRRSASCGRGRRATGVRRTGVPTGVPTTGPHGVS